MKCFSGFFDTTLQIPESTTGKMQLPPLLWLAKSSTGQSVKLSGSARLARIR